MRYVGKVAVPRRSPEQNRATYQRRNELARQRGFRNYADQRKQFRYAVESDDFTYGQASYTTVYGIPNARNPEDARRVRLFYDAFKRQPDNYRTDGPKAQWFVEIESIMDYDEWRERYPTGQRN